MQARGQISDLEMAKVTNLGIGMLVALRPDEVPRALTLLPELVPIGSIVRRPVGASQVLFGRPSAEASPSLQGPA